MLNVIILHYLQHIIKNLPLLFYGKGFLLCDKSGSPLVISFMMVLLLPTKSPVGYIRTVVGFSKVNRFYPFISLVHSLAKIRS